MQFTDPKKLALVNALVILFAFTILYIILSIMNGQFLFLLFIIAGLSLFTVSYFSIRYFLEKFIYDRIKVIYKNIRSQKANNGHDKNKRPGPDMLEKVNQEVMEWSKSKQEEIEHLKQLAQYRREFIGNVSHELKTPIFNIQGYVLTLLEGGMEDKTIYREYLLRTEKSIERMIDIITDLEAISQLESGVLQMNITRFDLVALTRDAIEMLENKAREKNTQFALDKTYEKGIYVIADQEKVQQALTNLLDNSIKYGKQDGRTKISFFDMDENILVEVTDNGPGIEQQDIPRLFERFYRTDKARSREMGGSGLGLAIVKHIIEAHGQSINVRSTVGVGSTFAFTLEKAT